MDGIADSLRLGWDALLLKEEAYERMRVAAEPVGKGLVLIIVVGVIIALLGVIGTALEWASTPDLGEIQEVVFRYLTQMPWWQEALRADPAFAQNFQEIWDWNWSIWPTVSGAPSTWGCAAANIIIVPLKLVIYWVLYGILAYIFARWLGGTADFSQTLGVLALAVAPQMLNVLGFLPYLTLGSLVSIWSVLCAYMGLKVAHKLTWGEAIWATLLPFILVLAGVFVVACCGSLALAAAIG